MMGFWVDNDTIDQSVRLMDDDGEIVMWTRREWEEEPDLVFAIVNAIEIGFRDGAGELRGMLA